MEQYENKLTTTLSAEEIEGLVIRYLEKIRSETAPEKTSEEEKIIDRIIEQATF